MALKTFTLLFVLLLFASYSKAQDCLLATNGNRTLPNFIRTGADAPRFGENPVQAIIASYRFDCCGVITEWRAYVQGSGSTFNGTYTISFQVWRPNSPSPVDTDGCYTLIGVNHFQDIPLADPESSEQGLVKGKPQKSERIEVQPGDVIGFYLTNTRSDTAGIQFANESESYTDEAVWFASGNDIFSNSPTCRFPIGPTRNFTNLAPLITALVAHAVITPTTTTASSTLLTSSRIKPPPTKPGAGLVGTGLTIGLAVLALVCVLFVLLVILVMVIYVMKKKRSKASQRIAQIIKAYGITESQITEIQTDNEPYYDVVGSKSTATISSIKKPENYYVNDPSNERDIVTSQNAAYGDIPTSTAKQDEQDDDYEVIKSPTTGTQISPKVDLLKVSNQDYVNVDPNGASVCETECARESLPSTTEHEVFTSTSSKTDKMETDDYIEMNPIQ